MGKKLKLTAGGDALIIKRLPKDYDDFKAIKFFIEQGDARVVNLETTITDGHCYGNATSGGTWLSANEHVLDDLLDYGFNLFSIGNNHALDYGYEGLRQTEEALRKRDIPYAGAGQTMYEASKAVKLDCPTSRVAMISICSTFNPGDVAGRQSEALPGRPGLNPLHFQTIYTVTPAHFKQLQEIAETTKMNALHDLHTRQGFLNATPAPLFYFGGLLFKEGEEESRFTTANQEDIDRTVHTIKDALKTCDYVVVTIHSHEVKLDSDEEADYFMEEFAHRCIEAGAHAVIGGGTHQLKGIEIYQGKPIFYSLGNFIFQNEYVEKLPSDYFEKHHFDTSMTATEGIIARSAKATLSLYDQADSFRTVIPYMEFNGDTCTNCILLPLELGMHKDVYFKNIPHIADHDQHKEIYDYLERVSSIYNTRFIDHGQYIEVVLKEE